MQINLSAARHTPVIIAAAARLQATVIRMSYLLMSYLFFLLLTDVICLCNMDPETVFQALFECMFTSDLLLHDYFSLRVKRDLSVKF